MELNANFNERVSVHAAKLPWKASPMPGVELSFSTVPDGCLGPPQRRRSSRCQQWRSSPPLSRNNGIGRALLITHESNENGDSLLPHADVIVCGG